VRIVRTFEPFPEPILLPPDTVLRAGAAMERRSDGGAAASVIRLNPAIRDRVKSGHREWPKT